MSKVNFNPAARSEPDCEGPIRLLARSGGYVMVRYPRMKPFVLTEKEWARLPLFNPSKDKDHG